MCLHRNSLYIFNECKIIQVSEFSDLGLNCWITKWLIDLKELTLHSIITSYTSPKHFSFYKLIGESHMSVLTDLY